MDEELLFEEIFKSLIHESKKIDIVYDYTKRYYKEESFAEYRIIKINGIYPYNLKNKVIELGREGLKNLKRIINQIDYENRVDYLENINEEVGYLKNIIQDDKIIYESDEYSPQKEVQFKTFKGANLIPNSPERNLGHDKSILMEASKYAIDWENGIDEIIGKINFLINQIELIPQSKMETKKDKNTIHVFYSWQSDIKSENQTIRNSLKNLIPHFKKKGKIVKIDSDMRGTTGSQDITTTLFHKINTSDIFVADVNMVSKSMYREELFSPNANVLIELGYAASKIGWERVILVYNSTSYPIEQLPFDIRQRAILWYENQPQLEEKLKFSINLLIKTKNN